MAPRLNKRQQREQEELAALSSQQIDAGDVEDTEERANVSKSAASFAALLSGEADESGDVESADEAVEEKGSKKKPKKKKKKASAKPETLSNPELPSESAQPAESKEQKRAAKKARQKEQKGKKDEVEKALEELSLKYPSIQAAIASGKDRSGEPSLSSLLTVLPGNLSPEAELRRFFGSKVVGTAPSSSSKHKPTSHRGILLNTASSSKVKGRNGLTTPKETWAHSRLREGLEAVAIDESEIPFYAFDSENKDRGEKWFTLRSSVKYKSWTRAFVETVHRGDPNPFYTILQSFPYHADTLMQMGEIAAHREEHSTVSSLLERALYTYERALQVGGANLLNGATRLDFDAVDNRGLWLCFGRYILDLLRRGCPSTAHNFTVLQLALDPYVDPYGALFMLDYTSVKCGKSTAEWFERLYLHKSAKGPKATEDTDVDGKGTDVSLWRWDCLPGWMYARALAQRIVEGDREDADRSVSNSLLLEAFNTYPELIPLIADKADIRLSTDLSKNKDTKIITDYSDAPDNANATLHLLGHLYVARSSPLWKLPANSGFFSSTLALFDPSAKRPPHLQSKRQTLLALLSSAHSPLSYSIYRHVFLASQSSPSGQIQNYKRLFKYFPRDIQNVLGRSLSFDPLPPPTASSRYNSGYWDGVESGLVTAGRAAAGQGGDRANARAVVAQIQGFLDANPEIAARFPGGAQQMAEMMVDDPGALFEGMIAEGELARGGGGMPGGLEHPAGDDDEAVVQEDAREEVEDEQSEEGQDNEEDEDDESEEEEAPAPTFFQSMFGRFFSFGGGTQTTQPRDDRAPDT